MSIHFFSTSKNVLKFSKDLVRPVSNIYIKYVKYRMVLLQKTRTERERVKKETEKNLFRPVTSFNGPTLVSPQNSTLSGLIS